MKLVKTCVAAFVALGLAAGASSAATVTITVGDNDFEIFAQSGEVDALMSVLDDQPWWGVLETAKKFAALVGPQLPDTIFAYDVAVVNILNGLPMTISVKGCNADECGEYEVGPFATAELVSTPLPAGSVLLLTGLAAAGGLARRRKKTAA